jgi:hypothetical protein
VKTSTQRRKAAKPQSRKKNDNKLAAKTPRKAEQ